MGVPENKNFSSEESIELFGTIIRIRLEIAGVDLSSVGLLRVITEQYPGHWMLMILWDQREPYVFLDRQDFESLVVVDATFRS